MDLAGWYPLALSTAIERGTSAGAVLGGNEIVVWRDTSGQAHAWEDRCPHRGMKLSFGFVRGDHIACLYHGWEYDTAGLCQYIPAHPKLEVPKSICVATYDAVEVSGMIWTRIGGVGTPPRDAAATPVRSLYLDAPLDAVLNAVPSVFASTGDTQREGQTLRLSTELGDMIIGLQPVDDNRTALHVTMAGPADPSAQLAVARRCEVLRATVEAELAS